MAESKRKHIRFSADKNLLAYLTDDLEADQWDDAWIGLVVNESTSGCNAVFLDQVPVEEGKTYLIRVGRLSPVQAKASWVKSVDDALKRVGFTYLQ